MKHTLQYLTLAGILALAWSGPLDAQHTQISASAVVVRGMAATSSTFVDFNIKRFSSDEERDALLRTLETDGQDALRRAVEKLDIGQVSPTGGVGVPIAFARKQQTEAGTLYTIVTARNMSFFELRASGRSTDYPFSVAQILVHNEGKKVKGEGQIIVMASIRFDERADRVTVESFGFEDTIRLTNVRVKEK